ncbi:MAG: inositol monophosphatase family protein [Gemmatimonadales bacterium]
MPNHHADLAFAISLAETAGEIIRDGYQRVGRIDRKSRRDVVTDVDYRSEAAVISAIRARFPDDAILAEESGHQQNGTAARRPWRARRTWVIDPLDGTVNYANRIPYFCVSVGLVEEGRPVVGVVLDPMRGECFAASADGPATLNGVATVAGAKDDLGDFVISLAIIGRGGIARERRVGKAVRIPRRMGSAALALAYVGNGRFDAFVQNGGLSLWDIAAAGLIAERAGATVTDLRGGHWWNPRKRPGMLSIVAAPPAHHAALLELLRGARVTVDSHR